MKKNIIYQIRMELMDNISRVDRFREYHPELTDVEQKELNSIRANLVAASNSCASIEFSET